MRPRTAAEEGIEGMGKGLHFLKKPDDGSKKPTDTLGRIGAFKHAAKRAKRGDEEAERTAAVAASNEGQADPPAAPRTPNAPWRDALPFAPGIISIVLFATPLATVGIMLGSAAFTAWVLYGRTPRSEATGGRTMRLPRATAATGAVGAVLCTIMLASASTRPPAVPEQTEPPAVTQQAETEADDEEPEPGTLSLAVNLDGVDGAGTVAVSMSGTSDEGDPVSKTVSVAPGRSRELDVEPGDYVFSIAADASSQEDIILRAASASYSFDGERDAELVLFASTDTEAMEQAEAQKEAERAAAEQAAQEEAQRRAEAKAQAQAQAEAEAAAQQQAQQSAQTPAQTAPPAASGQTNEETVYITDTGSKYHHLGCQYLRKSQHAISLSDAQARGYTPCSRCF